MRRRLIDAFNVMHRLEPFPEIMNRDAEEARERFLRLLAPLALRSKEAWTVVFDGPRGGHDRSPGPIDVVFAADADTWILRELRASLNASELTIVTSDEKDIGREARSMGATVVSAGALIASIQRDGTKVRSRPLITDKPEFSSANEVDYWLERFGVIGDDDAKGQGDLP